MRLSSWPAVLYTCTTVCVVVAGLPFVTLRRLGRARDALMREGKAPPNCFLARDARINAMLPLAGMMCNTQYSPPARTRTIKDFTRVIDYFLDFFTRGGPLRFLEEEDASFAARCACLKRSMLALLCTL